MFTTRKYRRGLAGALALLGCSALLVVGSATGAGAWSKSVNEVQRADQDGSAGTGYGPGWVMLTYKPNGPMVGYLFAKNFAFQDGSTRAESDHMDIRDTADGTAGNPEIDRWPWGYGAGNFGGCAHGYGTAKYAKVKDGFETGQCADGPRVRGDSDGDGTPDQLPWWHSQDVFCTDTSYSLCNKDGVWGENHGGGLKSTTTNADCPAFGNLGAAAVYGGGPAQQQVDIRYTTKDKQWVDAKWHGHTLAGGIAWAFLPTSCLNS